MRAGIDPAFVESLVDVLVTIHRRAERGDLLAADTNPVATVSPIDTALSATDLDAVAGRVDGVRFAPDGGDDRLAVRDGDEEILVVVDLQGIARSGHKTAVDASGDSLVLTVDDRFVWQVPVDGDPTTIRDVSVNNDLLEVRVSVDD